MQVAKQFSRGRTACVPFQHHWTWPLAESNWSAGISGHILETLILAEAQHVRSQHPAFQISGSLNFHHWRWHVKTCSRWPPNLPVPDAKGEWAPGHVPLEYESSKDKAPMLTLHKLIRLVWVTRCLTMDNWVALHSWVACCICGWTLTTGFGTFHPSHLSSTGSMKQYLAGHLAA